MTTTYGLLRSDELRQIRDTVLNPNGSLPQSPGSRSYYVEKFYGVLDSDLTAATNALIGSDVGVKRLKYIDITVDTEMEVDTETITVKSRSESMTGARGTLCLVSYMGAEYIFEWIDCEVSTTLLEILDAM